MGRDLGAVSPKQQTDLVGMTVNGHEAKRGLSRRLDLVEDGEEVVIVRHGPRLN
jgi:hypothetical protein